MQFIDRKTEDVGKARMKEELLYGRYNTKQMTIEELENPDLEILHNLLEHSPDMLGQWGIAAHDQTQTIL